MATTTTFDSLKTDIQRYLERGSSLASDPTVFEQIPRIINLAERMIARELKIQGFKEVVSGAMVTGENVVAKPTRWRDTISILLNVGSRKKTIVGRDYEYLRTFAPDESEQGEPVMYADYDYDSWIFAPTPDDAYTFELNYYALPPLLDDENQTNWLTDHAPQLLLFACLLQMEIFLKRDDRVALMQQQYDRVATGLNNQDLARIVDGAAERTEA